MKLAFSTNAFKKYSLEEAIRLIKEIGYEGVEILCDIPHAYPPHLKQEDILSIEKTVSKTKIKISNLNAFTLYAITDVYHPSWIENNSRLRELRIQHTNNCLNLARKVGAKNISTEPGGPIEINNKTINFNYNGSSDNGSRQYHIQKLQELFFEGITKSAKIAEE